MNIDLGNSNLYSILPSQVNTNYIMLNPNHTKLVTSKEDVVEAVQLRIESLLGDGTGSVAGPQTKLIEITGQLFCPNQLIQKYPSFYVSTLVSALINNNQRCLHEICQENGLFSKHEDISFLGPFDAVWNSSCFEEFGYDLIQNIFEAKDKGILTVNKFWAFDHYNYLIYSHSVQQVESIYMPKPIFGIEIALTVIMTAICLVTIFGNSLVFFAVAIDPGTKKSIYQYLQMSLCLADVTMGLAGAGSIILIQIGLLAGYINIYDFIDADVFTTTFDNPQEVSRSGLNQFYFITSRPGLVACGALVRYKMTVDNLLYKHDKQPLPQFVHHCVSATVVCYGIHEASSSHFFISSASTFSLRQ